MHSNYAKTDKTTARYKLQGVFNQVGTGWYHAQEMLCLAQHDAERKYYSLRFFFLLRNDFSIKLIGFPGLHVEPSTIQAKNKSNRFVFRNNSL